MTAGPVRKSLPRLAPYPDGIAGGSGAILFRPRQPGLCDSTDAAQQWKDDRHLEQVNSWAGVPSALLVHNLAIAVPRKRVSPMATTNTSERALARIRIPASASRLSRAARTRRAVLRYLAVWGAVAALALIAQAVAPAAAN